MTNAFQQTIMLLKQELDAIDQRRGEIVKAIETIRPLANAAAPRGKTKKALKRRTDGRTDGRTEQEPRRTATRSLPDVTPKRAAKAERILSALRAGPLSLAELAKTLKLKRPTLTYQLKPLLARGAVTATGATTNRQIGLPARAPKEAH